MSKPILLIVIIGITFVLLAEVEFIEGDNMAWVNDTINEKAFGGKVLQSVLKTVEKNLYKVTLLAMCLVLAISVFGEQIKFINTVLAIFIVMTHENKDKFIAYSCFLYAEYFYFTIRHSVIRLVIVFIFIAAFYFEVNLKEKGTANSTIARKRDTNL